MFRGGCLVQKELHSSEVARWGFLSRWSDFEPRLSRLPLSLLWGGICFVWVTMDRSQLSGIRGPQRTEKIQRKLFLPCRFEYIFPSLPGGASPSILSEPSIRGSQILLGFPSRLWVLLPSLHPLLPWCRHKIYFQSLDNDSSYSLYANNGTEKCSITVWNTP